MTELFFYSGYVAVWVDDGGKNSDIDKLFVVLNHFCAIMQSICIFKMSYWLIPIK